MVHLFDTTEVLARAFSAYRVNKEVIKETRRFSEDTPTLFSNKEIMSYTFKVANNAGPVDFIAGTYKSLQEDYDNAKEAVAFVNKDTALQQIAGTLSSFMETLVAHINSKSIPASEFGVVALLPKVYFEQKHKKNYKKTIKQSFGESKHIGLPGEVITGELTVNEIKWVDKFGCHVINGNMGDNLVSFFKDFKPEAVLPKVNDVIKVKAKVKRHGENFITKLPETQLNYVRFS
tara:strand:+ start:4057 stop:4755 length:699 start_codon:yes stop_codon:yes gene_type:complete